MHIATYLRVSTEDQNLEPQRLELQNYCTQNAWTPVGEWSDVMSGSMAQRPGLESLMLECMANRVDVILIVKLDRIGRSALNIAFLVKRLDSMNVALICTSQAIDTRKSHPCGRAQIAMLLALAIGFDDMIRARTFANIAVPKANGVILGRPSRRIIPRKEHEAVTRNWQLTRKGGLRGLALLLGGISPTTAQRIDRHYLAIPTVIPDTPYLPTPNGN